MSDRLTRRSLIRKGLIAGGAATGAGALGGLVDACGSSASKPFGSARTSVPAAGRRAPNILVVVVDQLRTPQWFQNGAIAAGLMPNLQRLRQGGVYFNGHYTAANDCTPSRGVLLTGLHSQQTGCLVTGGSTLAPQFPTWGTMLRERGYKTWWYGKWHLTHNDNRWSQANAGALERYGFSGGTYPSPDGGPGQGWEVDPQIAAQFKAWYAHAPKTQPWCTTVSFVNPHDIAWWYRWSRQARPERRAPRIVGGLPPNFETPQQMRARHKPRLQRSLQSTAQVSFGKVPYAGPHLAEAWLPFMDLYLKLLHEVDRHVGQVLDTLLSRPTIAANTVIVFTSDHGEYGASHGMRGKGAAAYEEALRIPLIVKDLRDQITSAPRQPRTGLTSSVDVAPLLLTIATGSNDWRKEPQHSQIAGRHDLAKMLGDPTAPGRPYVVHCTDELVTEFAIELYAANAPLHVTAIRTPTAKYALYSDWHPATSTPIASGQERELYLYDTAAGVMELDNLAGHSEKEAALESQLQAAIREELREPLPTFLRTAQHDGYTDYRDSAQKAAIKAARLRLKIEETEPPGRAAEKLGTA